MARKDDSPAISLFSFQDIITSLTGIMFLVVLLLVLSMMDLHKNDDPKLAENTRKISEAAAKWVKELELQLARLRQQERQYQKEIQALEKLDLDRLWIRLETARRDLQNCRMRTRELSSQRTLVGKAADQAIRQQKVLREEFVRENQTGTTLAKKIQQLQEEIKKRHAQTVKVRNALKYAVENNTSFSPVLAECTPAGVRIMDCRTGQESDLRVANGSFAERRRKFLEWIKARDRNDEYYTILLKPGSAEYGVLLDDLETLQKNRGVELLPSDELSLWGGK